MKILHSISSKIILPIIILIALSFRLYGINWDQGQHLHPDERMLIMVAERITFFENLNPDFFNYGSLPIYILRGVSEIVAFLSNNNVANYSGMLGIGRMLSAFFDTFTMILIYRIGCLLSKKKNIALLSAFVYSIAFFPIQNAHFFIVDPILTFFITATIYKLLHYLRKPIVKQLLLISLFAAGAITSKLTGILLLPVIGLGIFLAHLYAFQTTSKKQHLNRQYILRYTLQNFVLFTFSFILFTFAFMPYGFINYKQFISELSQQLKMNSDPFIFPYTLQYVGTTSYWYYLKNIVMWGLGPILSLLTIVGLFTFIIKLPALLIRSVKIMDLKSNLKLFSILVIAAYFLLHFGVLGKSAVKFMRYMLPLYPVFALFAGYGLFQISNFEMRNSKHITILTYRPIIIVILTCITIWIGMFMSIYTKPHTRIQASEWIYKNIPAGATLAIEHWDDQLPLGLTLGNNLVTYSAGRYRFESLELYNPDTTEKWQKINQQLSQSEYIILASNRLYTPLSRLTDCQNLPEHRCYPLTFKYYQELFNENRGFKKIAEFESFPELTVFGSRFMIDDSSADESFTVYDHPKVIIFIKKK